MQRENLGATTADGPFRALRRDQETRHVGIYSDCEAWQTIK
jgi:hypothetical protein